MVEASCSPSGPCSCRPVALSTTALEVIGLADGRHPTPDCFQPEMKNRKMIAAGCVTDLTKAK